jgi:hypothetical protein
MVMTCEPAAAVAYVKVGDSKGVLLAGRRALLIGDAPAGLAPDGGRHGEQTSEVRGTSGRFGLLRVSGFI